MPQVVDATTDSVNQQDNYSSDSTLTLGYSSATGGMSQAYFSYDLSDIYFDSLATPISALLELDLASSTQNIAPIDVSVFACDTFDEALITFANSPACLNSEITRATISSFSGNAVFSGILLIYYKLISTQIMIQSHLPLFQQQASLIPSNFTGSEK